MPFRWTHIRTVDPTAGHDRTVHQPFSLWWAALAAAEETLQGGPLVPAWLRLFAAHLSTSDIVRLRWGGDLGESAELRRAYSALYGRYFARALLANRLGFTDFVPLRTKKTRLPNGVTITRTRSGDIPDWIAWNPYSGQYVLGEAKGSLAGNETDFLWYQPTCVAEGKKQFQRVRVTDRRGRPIATRNWVAASLWSTDSRKRESVSLLWDPPSDGDDIPNAEREQHADGIRRRRVANLALRLGRFGLMSSARRLSGGIIHVSVKPSRDGMPTSIAPENVDHRLRPVDLPAQDPHEDTYAAALISPFGIRAIVDATDVQELLAIQAQAIRRSIPTMLFGLSVQCLRAEQIKREPWVSHDGIASPDGIGLFDLRRVEIRAE